MGITFELAPGKEFPKALYPERPGVKERTALASDPPARSPQAKSGPPSLSEALSSPLTGMTESRKAELEAVLAEAERRGREEPGSITVLVPSKRV